MAGDGGAQAVWRPSRPPHASSRTFFPINSMCVSSVRLCERGKDRLGCAPHLTCITQALTAGGSYDKHESVREGATLLVAAAGVSAAQSTTPVTKREVRDLRRDHRDVVRDTREARTDVRDLRADKRDVRQDRRQIRSPLTP